jgi:twitching motility protein PilT
VAAYEILVVTPGIANLIRENKTFRISSAIQTGAKFGMQLMDDALFKLWQEQKVVIEEVLGKAHSPDELAKRILNYQRGIMDDPNAPMGGGGPGGSVDPMSLPPGKPGGH